MFTRSLSLWLASLAVATAEKPAPRPANFDEIRALLNDPNGDLAKIAEGWIGEKGGNHLFYFPTRDEPATPATWGLKFETVNFKSKDGTPLHGWFIPAKGKTAKSAKATIVFSHGNAGAVGHHLGFCAWFAEAGYNVFAYDYRGFGKSGGSVDRRGMINDVKAAFSSISKRRDIDTNKIISYGHSLGGAQSITALGETPVKGLRAIIIDASFASYTSMARTIGGQFGEKLVTDELAPKDFIKHLSPTPLLVIHGTKDEVVPFSQGRALFEAAGEPKTFFQVEAATHGSALSGNKGAYRKKMITWLDQVIKG